MSTRPEITYRNLLIVGNGFDLNLGYPTSYEQFVKNTKDIGSGGFPFALGGEDYGNLGSFIREQTQVNSWFELENVLAEYGQLASVNPGDSEESNRADYNKLVEALALYLKSVNLYLPNKGTVAERVLKALEGTLSLPMVYSFNYTDFSTISEALHINLFGQACHVHGSLKENNIILGVGDYCNLGRTTDFMYKVSSPNRKSVNLLTDLEGSDNIIIFGLSLSMVDYPYFESFFRNITQGSIDSSSRKYIRIITYGEPDRMNILRNLRSMNPDMIKLFNYADIDIIRTKDNMDESKVDSLIKKLEDYWPIKDYQ